MKRLKRRYYRNWLEYIRDIRSVSYIHARMGEDVLKGFKKGLRKRLPRKYYKSWLGYILNRRFERLSGPTSVSFGAGVFLVVKTI